MSCQLSYKHLSRKHLSMQHEIFLLFSLNFKCAKIMLHVHFPSPENCGSVSTGRLFLGLFGCRIFLLWFEIIFWRFGMVLYEIFTLFLLTTIARGWFSGKHFLISCRNFWKVHMELLENIVKFPWGGGWVVCSIILMSNLVEKLIQATIKIRNLMFFGI